MFEVLEHTADIGFRARGRTLEEMFGEAAIARQSIAVDLSQAADRERFEFGAAGDYLDSLLVNFLNEVLYRLDGERVVLARFEVEPPAPETVRAVAWGERR